MAIPCQKNNTLPGISVIPLMKVAVFLEDFRVVLLSLLGAEAGAVPDCLTQFPNPKGTRQGKRQGERQGEDKQKGRERETI